MLEAYDGDEANADAHRSMGVDRVAPGAMQMHRSRVQDS